MINTAEVRIYSDFGWFNNIVFGQQGGYSVIGWQLHSITIQVSSVRFWADFLYTAVFLPKGGEMENKRIAVAAIVIDEQSAAVEVNNVLHDYSDIIIGRMGLPYKERGISLISVALDAEPDVISSLTGRLGQIQGVSVKAAISKK